MSQFPPPLRWPACEVVRAGRLREHSLVDEILDGLGVQVIVVTLSAKDDPGLPGSNPRCGFAVQHEGRGDAE